MILSQKQETLRKWRVDPLGCRRALQPHPLSRTTLPGRQVGTGVDPFTMPYEFYLQLASGGSFRRSPGLLGKEAPSDALEAFQSFAGSPCQSRDAAS